MSFGVEVLHPNGSTALDTEFPAYRFLGKFTGSVNTSFSVTSKYPPLIFSRTAGSKPMEVSPSSMVYQGSNIWEVSLTVNQYLVTPDDFRGFPAWKDVIAECYVFGVAPETTPSSGFGLELLKTDGSVGLSIGGATKTLIVDRRVFIDDNASPNRITNNYPADHGNIVGLDSSKKWAASVAWDTSFSGDYGWRDVIGFTRVLRKSTGGSSGVFIFARDGIHISPDNSFVTTINGQWMYSVTPGENKKRPQYLPVMLIDTNRYD